MTLKVNKDLLDYKFEGYKLSLDPIPILKQSIVDGVKNATLGSEDYGFLQTRLSLSHNSLFHDTWCEPCVFYVTKKCKVIWTALGEDGHLASPRCVWTVPTNEKTDVSICFPNADWALLCDGRSQVYVLYTSSRAAGEPWSLSHTVALESPSVYYLLHSAHRTTPSGMQMDFVLASAEPKSKLPSQLGVTNSSVCVLEWSSIMSNQCEKAWLRKCVRRLWSSSYPEYVAIDNAADAICIVSRTGFRFYYDSESPVDITCKEEGRQEPPTPRYTYLQTPEEVTVHFRLAPEVKKADIRVTIRPLHLEVNVGEGTVLQGDLPHFVDRNASTWTLQGDSLEVILCKAEVGLMWPEVVRGDREGEEVMDPALVEEVHQRLQHLTSDKEESGGRDVPFNLAQLEECDLEEEQLVLQRINGKEHLDMQNVTVSGWMFTSSLRPDWLPALCLRHDVDGLLWQPREVLQRDLEVEHTATFNALGYVLAGRKDRTYTSCDPQLRFAVVCDSGRHLYIYCRSENLSDSLLLRNRRTGESVSRVAKQYVVSLEQCDRLLGMRAATHAIYALAKDTLYVAKLDFDS